MQYDKKQYFTFTGQTLDYTSIECRQRKIERIHRIIFRKDYGKERSDLPATPGSSGVSDEEIIEKLSRAKNKDKFIGLMAGKWKAWGYSTESHADMGLCGIIAFWTQDKDQILRIIQKSKLWDEKWERKSYLNTINKVLENRKETNQPEYDWSKDKTITEPRSEEKSGLLTARDLLERDLTKPEMIISHGLLPCHGYTVLASYPNEGKTNLAMQMCLSIISGKEFLGFPIEKKTPILFFHLRDTDQDIQELLIRQTQEMELPDGILNRLYFNPKGLCLQKDSDIRYIRNEVEKRKAGLVVIDPISDAALYDTKKARTARSLVDYTRNINVSWLFIQPYEKSSSKSIKNIALDSPGWGNQYDSFIGMERYSPKHLSEYKRLILKPKHIKQSKELCIYINPETGLFEVVEDPNGISKISTDIVAKILEEQNKSMQHKDLISSVMEITKLSRTTAISLINNAREEGNIKKGDGKFGLYSI